MRILNFIEKKHINVGNILKTIVLIVVMVLLMLPFLWILILSLNKELSLFNVPIKLFPAPTFEHYIALFREADFKKFFTNSFIASFLGVGLGMVFGVPAAYVFSKVSFKANRFLFMLVLLSRITPGAVFIIPFYVVYMKMDLLDNIIGLGMIFIVITFGIVIWVLKPFFDDIPSSIEESAKIDGCSIMKTLLKISLPLATPGITTVAVLSFIFCWNEFFFALILTYREATTATVGILNLMEFEHIKWGAIAAASILTSLPVIIMGVVIRKYFVRGLATGAFK